MIESTLPKACGHNRCIQELQCRIYSLNYRIKEKVQKRISIVHEDREVEVFHRLLDGKASTTTNDEVAERLLLISYF